MLGPWTVEFNVVRLGDFTRAHVANDTDNFCGRARAASQQRFADRIFVSKDLLCTRQTDQKHILTIRGVMLVEIASGQKGNAPGFKVIRRNVVTGRGRAFIDGQNFAIGARIKHVAPASSQQRNVGADRRALETSDRMQRGQRSFCETLTRG